ncbi:MAG: CDP-alcohol phosphatidyltransferase family protein [Kiloniellales bacterium]|nr:CDP-alcohol phosphatidyltransferase family protein [Kiloniellales bacterium]
MVRAGVFAAPRGPVPDDIDVTPSTLLSLLPNLITLARLIAVPLMIYVLLEEAFIFAFWLFLAAGVSDAVDGLIAKQFGAVTEIGAYLDPIADKALLVSVYVTLGHLGVIEPWLVILIVSRDLMIVGGAILFQTLTQSLKMEPLWISKVNTAFQIVLVLVVLGKSGFGITQPWITETLTWAVAATTILSGGAYIYKWGLRALDMEGDL